MKTLTKRTTEGTKPMAQQALLRAARVARKTARMYGTPIYVEKHGKVVALKP